MVGDLFSAFVLTRTISEDSFAKYPVSDPSQRLSSQGQSLRDPSPPPGGSLQRTRMVPPKILVPRSLGEPFWSAGETLPGGVRGPSEIVLVRTNAEKGR